MVQDEALVELKTQEGKTYFWNRRDNSRSWALPDGVTVKWVGQKAQDGRTYYWSRGTKETVWVLPPLKSQSEEGQSGDAKDGSAPPLPSEAGPELPQEAAASAPPLPASKGPELPKDAASPSGAAPRLPSEAGPELPKEATSGASAPPLPAAAGPELPKETSSPGGAAAPVEESPARAEAAPAAAAAAESPKEKAAKQAAEAEGGAQAGVVASGLQGMLQNVPGMPMGMPLLLAAQMQPQPQPQLLGMMPGMLPGMLPGLPGMPMGMMPTGLPGMLPGLPGMPMGMSLPLAAQMAQTQPQAQAQAQALAQAQGVMPPHPPPGVLPPPGPPPGVLPPPGPPPGSAQAIAQMQASGAKPGEDAMRSRDGAVEEQGAASKDEEEEEEEEDEAEADLSEPHVALPDEDGVAGPTGDSASAVAARHIIEKSGCDSWFRRLPSGEWEEVVRFWPLPRGFAMPKLYLPRRRKGKRKADKFGLKKVLLRCQAHEEMVRSLLMAQYRNDFNFSAKKFPSPKSSDWCFWTQEGRQFIVDAMLAQDLPEDSPEGVRRAPPEGDRYRLLRPAVRSCLSSVFLSPMLRKLERATKSGDKAATKDVLDLLSKSEVPWKLSRDANKLVNPPQPKQEAASELPVKPLDPTSMPIPTKAKGGVFIPPPAMKEVSGTGLPMQSLPDGPPVFVKAASELPRNLDPMSMAIPTKAKGGAFAPPPATMNEAPSPGVPMQSGPDSPPVFSKGGFRPPAAAGAPNNMAAPDVAAFPFKSKAPGPPPMLVGSAPAMDGGMSQGPMVFTKASAAGPMSTVAPAPSSAAGFQAPAQPMAPLYKQPPSEAQPMQSQLQPPPPQQQPPQQQLPLPPQQQQLPPPPQQPPPSLQQPQQQQQQLPPPPQQQLLPPPPQQPPPSLQQQQQASQPAQLSPLLQQPPPPTQQPPQTEQQQPPQSQQQQQPPQLPPQQPEQQQQTPQPQQQQQPPQQQQQPVQPQPQPQQEQPPQQKTPELQQQPVQPQQQPAQSVQPPAFKAPPLQQFGAGQPAANPPATSSTATAFQVPPSTVATAATMGSEAAGEPDQAAPWAARKRRRTRGGDAAGSTPAQDASAGGADVNGGQQKEAPRSVADHAAADRIAAAAEKVAAATGQDARIERLRRKVMVANIAAPAKATELADFVTGAIFSATGHTLAAQWQSGEASKVVVEVDFSVSQAAGEASGGSVAEVTLAKATAASVAVALNGIQYKGKALEIKRPKGFIGEPLKRSQLQSISIKDLVGSEDAAALHADEPTRREGATVKGSTRSIAVVQLTGIPASMNERSVFDLLQQFGGPLRRLSLAGVGASGSHDGHGTAEYVEASSAAEAVRFSPLLGLIEVRIAEEAAGEAPAPKRQRRSRFGDAEAEDLGPFEAAFRSQSNEGDTALDLGPFEAVLPPSKSADKADMDLGVFEAVLPPSDKRGGNDMVEDLGPFAAALQGL